MRTARCLLLVLCLSPALALAQPRSNEEKAIELVTRSRDLYDAGRFAEALELLRRARELDDDPILFYNMARAHEGLGELEAALDAYRQYIAKQPKAPDRGAVERRIASLEKQLVERDRLAKERDLAAKRAAEARRQAERERSQRQKSDRLRERAKDEQRRNVVPWIVAGVGGAALATGGVLGVITLQRHADAENDPVGYDSEQTNDSAKTFATAANACFVAGGALVIVGLGWAWLDASNRETTTVALGPGVVSLTGRFR